MLVPGLFRCRSTGDDGARHEVMFHLRFGGFGGVPVVVRPSGENFPSPSGQFQSIGQKKFQIPTWEATHETKLSFLRIVVPFPPICPKVNKARDDFLSF